MLNVTLPNLVINIGFLEHLLLAIGILATTITAAILVRLVFRRWVSHALPRHIYKPLENIVFYLIVGIGIASSLSPFGVDLTFLVITGGIAGIVLGFASQTIFSNMLGGMFLFIERPFRVGDPVNIGGNQGVVVDVNMFSTVIRTWDGVLVRIPNEKTFNETILNFAKTAARRIEYDIGISYTSDVDKAKNAILEVISDHPYCLIRPEPEVFVKEFADSAIVLTIRCWTPVQTWFETRNSLLKLIYDSLRKHKIEIPYPQLDVHIKDISTPFIIGNSGGASHAQFGHSIGGEELGAPRASSKGGNDE